jgi:hypothetical protein
MTSNVIRFLKKPHFCVEICVISTTGVDFKVNSLVHTRDKKYECGLCLSGQQERSSFYPARSRLGRLEIEIRLLALTESLRPSCSQDVHDFSDGVIFGIAICEQTE